MRKTLALLGLTLAVLFGLLTAVPAQAVQERYIWTACGPYLYRQVGPDDSRIMRFRSCQRVHQVINIVTGGWKNDQVNSHGELTCKVNVPHTSAPIGDRFALGSLHACSMNLITGFTFANGEEAGDAQTSDTWSLGNSGSDGLWFKCLGESCSTINSYWDVCRGSDLWHARFNWFDAGLDGYHRYGSVAVSRSEEFGC